MLRQDAEENSAPGHVLTLTSRDGFTGKGDKLTARAYSEACRFFWRSFRKRWGRVEFCGFIEWTTGEGPRSGGKRRMHSHWLVKGLAVEDLGAVEDWCRVEWCKLTGAWVVQLAELRTVGGVVGYLALHHEKMSQAPPPGWTGRRLRPSKGYFAVSGKVRRERARLWLSQYRAERLGATEGVGLTLASRRPPRLLFGRTQLDAYLSSIVAGVPGPRFGSTLRDVQEHEKRLLRAAALRAAEDETDRYARLWHEAMTGEALRARRRRVERGSPPAAAV